MLAGRVAALFRQQASVAGSGCGANIPRAVFGRPALGFRRPPLVAGRPLVAVRAFAAAAKPAQPSALASAARCGALAKDAAVRVFPLAQVVVTWVSKSRVAQMWTKQARKSIDVVLEMMGAQWKAYFHQHFRKIVFVTTVVCLYYVLRNLIDFLGVFLKNVESSFFYVLQLSTLILAVLAAMHIHGRLHLSGSRAHKLATHLVRTSSSSVVAERLGSRIRADSMRIVTRSGGDLRLISPQNPEVETQLAEQAEALQQSEATKEQMALEAQQASTPPAPDMSSVMDGPALLLAHLRRRLAKLRAQSKTILAQLHVPHLEYKPAKAQLVFPVTGTLGKAMVSVQVTKHAGGLNGTYTFQLLALDFVDNTYELLYGDEEAYHSEVGAQLRLPMVTWLQNSNAIEAEEERDDEAAEAERERAERERKQSFLLSFSQNAKKAQERIDADRGA